MSRAACALALVGCTEARDEGMGLESETLDLSTSSSGAADSSESGLEPDPLSDVPPPETGIDPDADRGCTKVDFLFVIDHSGSMASEQEALVASFQGFIDAIEERVGFDGTFHIMVADVDAWVYGACEDEACLPAAQCEADNGACDCGFPCALRDVCTEHGDYVCGQTQPLECEDVLGAGVVHPRGGGSSNTDCGFTSGARYIDGGQPDLAEAFACAATVGTGSSNPELPMEALVEALRPGGAAAACNTGFLRDDALLVLTVITDEDDNGIQAGDPVGDSPGTPKDWFDTVVEAKGGNADAVVTLALIGDNNQGNALCAPLDHATGLGAEDCPRIREFTALFGNQGHVASICAQSYTPFFDEAVESIGQACDEFTPEG